MQRVKKTFLTLQCSTLESTVVQYNSRTAEANRQEELLVEEGEEGEMVGLKDHQQETEARCSSLMPDVDGTHVRIFESSQLEGLYVGDLLQPLSRTRMDIVHSMLPGPCFQRADSSPRGLMSSSPGMRTHTSLSGRLRRKYHVV